MNKIKDNINIDVYIFDYMRINAIIYNRYIYNNKCIY